MGVEERYTKVRGKLTELANEEVRLEYQLENAEEKFNESKEALKERGIEFKSFKDIENAKQEQEQKVEDMLTAVESQLN